MLQAAINAASHVAAVATANAILDRGIARRADAGISLCVMVSVYASHVIGSWRSFVAVVAAEGWAAIRNA